MKLNPKNNQQGAKFKADWMQTIDQQHLHWLKYRQAAEARVCKSEVKKYRSKDAPKYRQAAEARTCAKQSYIGAAETLSPKP
jgi:hypothetical protein